MSKIKELFISFLDLNSIDFQKKPKIYDSLYLLHSSQLKLLKNFINENLSNLKNITVLDLGCGLKPYESLFKPYVSTYIGTDSKKTKGVDIVCQAEKINLADQSCNVILALQMLEHSDDPLKVLKEIYRLLTKDGSAFITIPACFCYHPGIRQYRPGVPITDIDYPDYWRWTEAGIKKVLRENFTYKRIDVLPIGGFFQTFGLQLAFLITESAKSINKYFCYLLMFTIIPIINIVSICMDKIFYKWNILNCPYTVFLGYAITLKK
ncbi:MAG: class I SAM-dependent methyltransferase [Candidatus Omnitrophica bacterium]|nr:class I SAM-dependent methyltransferase [Candidatus Omnitrophota bacterium]